LSPKSKSANRAQTPSTGSLHHPRPTREAQAPQTHPTSPKSPSFRHKMNHFNENPVIIRLPKSISAGRTSNSQHWQPPSPPAHPRSPSVPNSPHTPEIAAFQTHPERNPRISNPQTHCPTDILFVPKTKQRTTPECLLPSVNTCRLYSSLY